MTAPRNFAAAIVFATLLLSEKSIGGDMNIEHPPLFPTQEEILMSPDSDEFSRCREAQEKFARNLDGKITETRAYFSGAWGYILRSSVWAEARNDEEAFSTFLLCWQSVGSPIVNLYPE